MSKWSIAAGLAFYDADGRRDNVIVLNAVLRNQAQFAQEYPALELTLTDDDQMDRRLEVKAGK